MNWTTLQLEINQEQATLWLNRPHCGNTLSVEMINELRKALQHLEDETEVKVVFLAGRGPHFCKGVDLEDFSPDGIPDIHGFNRWEKICRTLERLPAVTIAVLDGEVAGGGLQLALACDIRVATTRAWFHLHDVRMGIIPGMGTYRLGKFIGLGRARRMALTGRHMDATEAEHTGLIDHLADVDALWAKADEAVAEFGPIHPDAVMLIRRLMDESYENSWEDFLGNFLAAQDRAIRSAEFRGTLQKAHGSSQDNPEDEDE
jgi:enoyl-CoA hydratase/carnithine racemase